MIPQKVFKSLAFQPLASAPSNPSVGEIYLDAASQQYLKWNGSNWVQFSPYIAATALALTPQAITGDDPMNVDTVTFDNTGLITSTGPLEFTIKESGIYLLTASLDCEGAATFQPYAYVTVNGSNRNQKVFAAGALSAAGLVGLCVSGTLILSQGDAVRLLVGAGGFSLTVNFISGSQVSLVKLG